MTTYCISQLEGVSPIQMISIAELSSQEKEVANKIQEASSEDEVVEIISEELVRSLMEQINVL